MHVWNWFNGCLRVLTLPSGAVHLQAALKLSSFLYPSMGALSSGINGKKPQSPSRGMLMVSAAWGWYLNLSLAKTKRICAFSKCNAHEAMESLSFWKLFCLPYRLIKRRGGTGIMIRRCADYYTLPGPCLRHLETNSIHIVFASWLIKVLVFHLSSSPLWLNWTCRPAFAALYAS